MKFSWGQRLAIRIIAFALKRSPASAPELREALDRAYRRRTQDERYAMWQAARNRAFNFDYAS